MTPERLSVVVCAYTTDRWDDLTAALRSAQAQSPAVREVLLVVDHSDELLRRAREELDGITVLASDGPKGLSGARNTGWHAASGDIIAFLDDDAVADEAWATELAAAFAEPQVLGVGGLAVPAWDAGRPRWMPEEFDWVVGCSYRGLPTTTGQVRNLIGCNMAVRRDVLERVGGFDTELGRTASRPLGCEETELCIRASELFSGGIFLMEPRAVAHHRVRAERGRWSYFRARCQAEGVSKAWVAGRVGQDSALSAERAHALKVLPVGVLRGFRALTSGDTWGPARSGAIVAGLGYTSVSYLAELRRGRRSAAGADEALQPVLPVVVDLSAPLLDIGSKQGKYEIARCLVVVQGAPLGTVDVPLGASGVDADQLSAALWSGLGEQIGHAAEAARQGAGPLTRAGFDLGPVDVVTDERATVVIATKDRPDHLRDCLRSVLNGVTVPAQLIVVDNAPSDDRGKAVVDEFSASHPGVTYVREMQPGLGRAHNAALPHVRGTYAVFTDDDVVVHRWWLRRMLEAFDRGPDVVCVTGMITPLELDTPTQQTIEAYSGFSKGFDPKLFDTGDHRPDSPLFPFAAGLLGSGANMAFRTDYLASVGGFDPALGAGTIALGGDDLAAFYDVMVHGRQLAYEPAAIVEHRHHRDPDALARQAYGYGAGLSAHLARCVIEDPKAAAQMLRRAPSGFQRARSIAQPDATGRPPAPAGLSRHHLRGMVAGPWRYVRSRRKERRSTRSGYSGVDAAPPTKVPS